MSATLTHRVQCSVCGFRYRLKPAQLGKKLRCQECKEVFTAVDSDAAAHPEAPAVVAAPVKTVKPAKPVQPIAPPVETQEDDFLFDIPPEPVVSQHQVFVPPASIQTGSKKSTAAAKVGGVLTTSLPVPWWLATNRFEAGVVIASVLLLVAALVIGGRAGAIFALIVMLVAVIELLIGMWLFVRASGRNGYNNALFIILILVGGVVPVVLLFALAQLFSANTEMRNAAARPIRGLVLMVMFVLLSLQMTSGMDNNPRRHAAVHQDESASIALLVDRKETRFLA